MKRLLVISLLIFSSCGPKHEPFQGETVLSLSENGPKTEDLKLTDNSTLCDYSKGLSLFYGIQKKQVELSKTISRFKTLEEIDYVMEKDILQFATNLKKQSFMNSSIVNEKKIEGWLSSIDEVDNQTITNHKMAKCLDMAKHELQYNDLKEHLKSALSTSLRAEKELVKILPRAKKVLRSQLWMKLLLARQLILKVQQSGNSESENVEAISLLISDITFTGQSYGNLLHDKLPTMLQALANIATTDEATFINEIQPETYNFNFLIFVSTLREIDNLIHEMRSYEI
jgi:hypothetical protein